MVTIGLVVSPGQATREPGGVNPAFYIPLVMHDKCMVVRPLSLFGAQLYGVSGAGTPYDPELVDSGATVVRNEIGWGGIEPANTTPDKFTWAGTDKVIAIATQRCYVVVLNMVTNPFWASTMPQGPLDKVGYDEMAQFLGALAERYDGDGVADAPGSPHVIYFELYNEPDAGESPVEERWGLHGDAYATMLKTVYPAIKAANPQAQVVFGGVAHDFFTDADPITPSNNGPFVRRFIEDVFKNGGGAYIDVMNFHFYPLFASNWVKNFPKEGPGLVDKTAAIRALMAKYGIDKPIMITEAGWHNNETIPHGSDTLQVRFVQQIYAQAIAAGVQMVAWWPLGDVGGSYQYDSGLVTRWSAGGVITRKPAYSAYQVMVRELGTARFVAELALGVDIKVYKLQDDVRGRTLYVAWTNPTDAQTVFGTPSVPYVDTTRTTPIVLPGERVGIYDAFWSKVATVPDAADGKDDGRVKVTINGDPKYIVVEAK